MTRSRPLQVEVLARVLVDELVPLAALAPLVEPVPELVELRRASAEQQEPLALPVKAEQQEPLAQQELLAPVEPQTIPMAA